MKIEVKELYCFTKNEFIEELERISPDCISPIIAIRQVVKKAIEKYCIDYCTDNDNPFSNDDFKEVSNRIYYEILDNELS